MAEQTISYHCRICFQEHNVLIDIFAEQITDTISSNDNFSLRDMLQNCGDIIVEKDDKYSNFLCEKCTIELLQAVDFRNKCARAKEIYAAQELTTEMECIPSEEELQTSVEHINIIELGVDDMCSYASEEESNPYLQLSTQAGQKTKINLEENIHCYVCGASFNIIANLERHMSKMHSLYQCHYCRHSFSNVSAYNLHMRICGRTKKIQPKSLIKCDHCGKLCASSSALKMHLRTHTGERPFGCTICDKTFKTQSSLNGHMLRHNGPPARVCSYCPKTFYDVSNLNSHMRTHFDYKPHKCTYCAKRFSRVDILQNHIRTHTGERPFQCCLCTSAFAQRSDLIYHEKTHTGGNLKCQFCDKLFIKKNSLRLHVAREHAELSQNENNNSVIEEVAIENCDF